MNAAYIVAVIVAAAAWAKLEVEIEGPEGWARTLPTWRVESHPLLDIFYGARPLTGYHAWAFTFVLLALHLPFAWTGAWSLRGELHVLACYALFWLVEDFLWFLFNPAFGWSGFCPARAWWHKRWFLGLPVDYWIFALAAAGIFTWT